MERDTEPTPVVFRRFSDGDVIAIFPQQLGTNDPATCGSYLHIGQHGAARPEWLTRITRPAKPDEYRDLFAELESIGYRLELRKRCTRADYAERRRQLAAACNG